MYFEFLLLHHARPFENLSKDKIHQDSWQMEGMSNLHSTSNSHWCFSKFWATRNQDSWRASGMSNCRADQRLLVAKIICKILACRVWRWAKRQWWWWWWWCLSVYFSILLILVQYTSVQISKHVGSKLYNLLRWW